MARNPPRISSAPVSPSGAAVVHVLESHDVVFPGKANRTAPLDDLQRNGTGIFQAMAGADRDVGGLVFESRNSLSSGDPRGPADHDPVFGTMVVHLQGQRCARRHGQTFHLEALAFVHALERPPGPMHPAMKFTLATPLFIRYWVTRLTSCA